MVIFAGIEISIIKKEKKQILRLYLFNLSTFHEFN